MKIKTKDLSALGTIISKGKKEKVLVTFSFSLGYRSSQIEFERDELIKILNDKETKFDIRPDDRNAIPSPNVLINIAGNERYLTSLWKPNDNCLEIIEERNEADAAFFYEEALKRGESLDWVEFSKSVLQPYSLTKFLYERREKRREGFINNERIKGNPNEIGVKFKRDVEEYIPEIIEDLNDSDFPPIFKVYENQKVELKILLNILSKNFYYTALWDINETKLVILEYWNRDNFGISGYVRQVEEVGIPYNRNIPFVHANGEYSLLNFILDKPDNEKAEYVTPIKKPKRDIASHINLLLYKKQIILQGPPGTGKTRRAKKIARKITGGNFDEQIKLIQFHPAYSYEDFVRGIVAKTSEKGIIYEVENKILGEMAQKSRENPEKNFVLIIDEINRANLSAVLGELIYALEYRGESVDCVYAINGDNSLMLPQNLYIIGTMNTADRSVGHLDYAIRRRFAFVDILPEDLSDTFGKNFAQNWFSKVSELFDNYLSSDFKKEQVQLGHSYFITENTDISTRWEYEIMPILLEYARDGVLFGEDIEETIKNLPNEINPS